MQQLILPAFPLPPSTNNAYYDAPFLKPGAPQVLRGWRDIQRWVGCRKVMTKEGVAYKQEAARILNESGMTTQLREFVTRNITVDIYMYVYQPNWLTLKGTPNKNAGDEDNRVKLLKDSIFQCIGIDDAASFMTTARKMYGEERKVIVVVTQTPEVVDEF